MNGTNKVLSAVVKRSSDTSLTIVIERLFNRCSASQCDQQRHTLKHNIQTLIENALEGMAFETYILSFSSKCPKEHFACYG